MTISERPLALDLSHHLSVEAKSRSESALKSAFKYFNDPNITFLGGGLPLSDYFPFDNIKSDVPTPGFANGIGAKVTESDKTEIVVHKNKALNDPKIKDIELSRSLQYGHSEGQAEIRDFLKVHTERIHKVPYSDWDLISTVGNTQGWDAALRIFTTRGDSALVEEFSFSSALGAAVAQGINTIPIPMDHEGIQPEALAELLESWVGPKPKLLYTICTGQNPTGSCLSAERRRAIYKLAQEHDFIIIEDEPYYFLQMDTYTSDVPTRSERVVHGHDEFVKALVPSFISLDIDGRVIRLDSFSKVLAPGLRLGWIVGQAKLLERFVRLHEVTIQAPAGITQTLTNATLQRWGQSGYLDWLIGLRSEYTHKRDVAIDAIAKYFPAEIIDYVPPVAGMFFIVSVDATKHPKFATEFESDPLKVESAVFDQAIEQGTLMIPGSWFKAHGQSTPPQPHLPINPRSKTHFFFRGTYAAVPLDELTRGLEKFGKALKVEFGL